MVIDLVDRLTGKVVWEIKSFGDDGREALLELIECSARPSPKPATAETTAAIPTRAPTDQSRPRPQRRRASAGAATAATATPAPIATPAVFIGSGAPRNIVERRKAQDRGRPTPRKTRCRQR